MIVLATDRPLSKETQNSIARHPLQSYEWGEAREQMGIKVVKFCEYSHESLSNIFQMTIHRIPCTSCFVGYIPRSQLPSNQITTYIKQYCLKHNIIFVKFEPYETIQDKTINAELNTSWIKKSPHPLFPSWTQVLDITQTENTLLSHMKPKTRYNIRLAQKKDIVVKEVSNSSGFEIFIKLYFETCKRQKYHGHNQDYHRIVWNRLKSKIAHILIAYYKEEPLAAYEVFLYKNRLYYVYGGSSTMHKNLMAPNLLMWETIRFGKKMGASVLDMWGSLPPNYNPQNNWAGFTRFKEGYGTTFVKFYESFDLIINPILYHLYSGVYAIRNLILHA